MILAGDIGATKTILALFDPDNGPRFPKETMTLSSAASDSLESMIEVFLDGKDVRLERASFGVAGPVLDGQVLLMNLGWRINQESLVDHLGGIPVDLLNDLAATATFIPELEPEDIFTLNKGQPIKQGAIAVIAPGTGLGEAFLVWQEDEYLAIPSEGSDVSFAPTNALEIELLAYLLERFDHVSYESVCSGLGIMNIFNFLKNQKKLQEPTWLAERLLDSDDATPVIIDAALDEDVDCELCRATLDLFVSILGAEAGNLALKVLATGGVYIGGGIPPRILSKFSENIFLQSFTNKGRYSDMLSKIPVYVITNPNLGLYGAATLAMKGLSQ
ncbi:MAG: glucokinase [Chloroflexi bacterium]|nr:glucokinase [Chloroflexota bacterium]